MKRLVLLSLILSIGLIALGCGSHEKLRTKGRLIKGGVDFVPDVDQYIQVTFMPVPADGGIARDYYYADVDQDTGIFVPAGKDRQGMPPGKYRVAVELMEQRKDLLRGKFNTENTPYVVDVDAETQEIVIDLDNPPQI